LKIGCQGGETSKWKHEPLKVNFPPFLGGVRPVLSSLAYIQMLLDTRKKNIYMVGIPTVFKIFDHFLYQEGQDHSVWSWPTYMYHQMLLDTRKNNIHGLGVGISTVCEIFGHFLYQRGTASLNMVINFTLSFATWHKKREYIHVWFRGLDLNRFWNIWALRV
jgi:hypothetical protein